MSAPWTLLSGSVHWKPPYLERYWKRTLLSSQKYSNEYPWMFTLKHKVICHCNDKRHLVPHVVSTHHTVFDNTPYTSDQAGPTQHESFSKALQIVHTCLSYSRLSWNIRYNSIALPVIYYTYMKSCSWNNQNCLRGKIAHPWWDSNHNLLIKCPVLLTTGVQEWVIIQAHDLGYWLRRKRIVHKC